VSRGLAVSLVVLVLLAATAVAFAVTEGLKLEPPAISGTRTPKLFSPTCKCSDARAAIVFRLRRADRMTVAIVDPDGRVVRTLRKRADVRAGMQRVTWDGRDEHGRLAPDGTYHVRVRLVRRERRIQFPNTIRLDTTPPRIRAFRVSPPVFSPDGDGHSDKAKASYRLGERGHVTLYVDGRKAVGPSRFAESAGKLDWYGKVGGRAVPPGRYRLTLVARDLAENVSAPTAPVTVRLRYVSLRKRVFQVRARRRFAVRVDSDAPTVTWQLGTRHGGGRSKPLVLRAPARRGRYVLVVRAGSHAARATVVVGS
jgi:hypothetical protein